MNIQMTFKIWFGDEGDKFVDLNIEATYGNRGIGKYEYWGAVYTDDNWCWEIEYIDWDRSKYTDEENKIIEDFTIEEEQLILMELLEIN